MPQWKTSIAASVQKWLIWGLLVVLAMSTLSLGGNRPVVWTLMALAVLLIFALQMLIELISQRPDVFNRLWAPGVLFLAVLAWALLQRSAILPQGWAHPVWDALQPLSEENAGRVSADPAAGRHGVMRLASYAMIFWIALRAAADRDLALRLLMAFALFSTGLAIFGLYAWSSGDNPILGATAGRTLSASFVNRNNYSTFAAFGLLANLALYMHRAQSRSGSSRAALRDAIEGFFSGGWLWSMGILLCGAALALTQSRAGAAAGLVGVISFFVIYRAGGRGISVAALVVGIGATIAALLATAGGLAGRLLASPEEDGRFLVFPKIYEAIFDRPLLGHGLGAFEDAFRPYVPLEAALGEWDMAHNSYLENAFELGLVAAAALYVSLGLIIWRIWRGRTERHRSQTVLAFAFACAMVAAFHAAFDFSLQMPGLVGFFAFILGLGYAQSFPTAAITGRKTP